jgi:hypothetical protein
MRFSVLINKMDGGLNTKVSPLIAPLNESPDCQNVVFDDLGAVQTREGRELAVETSIASAQVDLLHSYVKDDGTEQLIVAVGGSLYRMSGNTAVIIASATSVFTQDVRIQALNYQNQLWMSNGGVTPYKWNGTEFTQWGIPVPSAPTGATASDGGLIGQYRYVVLGVNSNLVQGDYGSESTQISATSKEIILTDIPVFPISAGVIYKQICRNTANASGIYYVVTEITNAQTFYTDSAIDSNLVTLAPLDQGTPAYFTTMLAHNGRIFAAGEDSEYPTYLWFSETNIPEVFPSENFLRIGDGDGFPIVGLAMVSNNIIIAKNDGQGNGSTWLLYMPDNNPLNWMVAKLDAENSGQSQNSMVKFNNYLAYLNKFGVFDISEFAVGDIRNDALSFNIEPDILNLSLSNLKVSFAVNWKNKVWFSVPYGPSVDRNNRVYQYDYMRGRSGTERELGAWTKFTNMNFSSFAIHDGDLYGGSSQDDGKIYKLNVGYNDAGEAIESYYKTMAITGLKEHKYHTKVWRFLYVTVEAVGDWLLDVEILKDFDVNGQIEQISLDPGGDEYDSVILGEAYWGNGLLKLRKKISIRNAVCKSIQLKFSTYTADQYFKIDEIEVFYNLRSLRQGNL